MQIPYGRSNFEEIRRRGYFYVDKTPFIPLLESAHVGYPLFLRPGRFAWMLEVKYLKTQAKAPAIEAAFEQAFEQLDRYVSDRQLVALLTLGKELRAGALVFVGAKDVLFRPWAEGPRTARKGGKRPRKKSRTSTRER
jgi:hypothetical protein